jgi:hypothetical protein
MESCQMRHLTPSIGRVKCPLTHVTRARTDADYEHSV